MLANDIVIRFWIGSHDNYAFRKLKYPGSRGACESGLASLWEAQVMRLPLRKRSWFVAPVVIRLMLIVKVGEGRVEAGNRCAAVSFETRTSVLPLISVGR